MSIFRRKRFYFALLMALSILFLYCMKHKGYISDERLMMLIRAYPTLAPLVFVALYGLCAVFLIPTLPLNLGAGYLWGGAWGGVFSMGGVAVGASCSFLLARYLLGGYFRRRHRGRFLRILQEEIDEKGWKAVALCRVSPAFPSGLMNYFFGITSIPFVTYIVTSLLFLLPATIGFAFLGDAIGGYTLQKEHTGLLLKLAAASAVICLFVIVSCVSNRYLARGKLNDENNLACPHPE